VTSLTHKDVTAMLGPADDVTVAEIIATGATAEGKAWLTNDEALMNLGKPLPAGRVAGLIEILTAIEEEEVEQELARSG
jgi:hypothetical protein